MAKARPLDLTVGEALPLGSRIRLRREARGIRLSTMADTLGYNRGYLSHVENNRAMPSAELVQKIADFLSVSVQELKEAPLDRLAPAAASWRPRGPARPALPVQMPPKKRTIGQRIERLVASAHLAPEEEALVADHLVAVTSDALAFLTAVRRLRTEAHEHERWDGEEAAAAGSPGPPDGRG
jgi:transcriptional regulator with XRE-family HTH domain